MSKLKKSALIAAALTICITANAFSDMDKAFALTAPVMPTENAQTIRSESDTEDVFSILPKTIADYNQFVEKYGNVSVHEKYIVYCDEVNYSTGTDVIMEQFGTAEIKKVKEYSIETDEPLTPGSQSNVVYVYEAITPGTVKVTISQGKPWELETSKEVKDESNYEVAENLTIKKIEEDDPVITPNTPTELDWLPKTIKEYNEFIAKYGNVSVHEKYIVYCDEVNYSTGTDVIMEQLGTAEVKKVKEYSVETDEPLPPGVSNNVVYVYEAVKSGTVKVTISQGRPWELETSKEVKDESNYEVAENLTINKIPEIVTKPVKGDINADGKLSVADVVLLQQWLVKKTNRTLENADINKDGAVNAFDLILLKRMLIDESRVN